MNTHVKTLTLQAAPKSESKLRVRMALRELLVDKREQRGERRIPYLEVATVAPASAPEQTISVFIRDLAPGGIGLVHRTPLPLDDVIITLRLPRDRTVEMVTRIVWCSEFSDGWFASGGRFLDTLEASHH